MSWIEYNPLAAKPGDFNWNGVMYMTGLAGIGFVAIQVINKAYDEQANPKKTVAKRLGTANEARTVYLEAFNHQGKTMDHLAAADNPDRTTEPDVTANVPIRGEDTEMAAKKKHTNRVPRPDTFSVNPMNVQQVDFYGQVQGDTRVSSSAQAAQADRTALVNPSLVAANQSVRKEQMRRKTVKF